MSDTEVDNSLDSDSTIETVQFESVLLALQLAAQDAKETGDFLSYSTVLDVYLSEPNRYSEFEREQLLSHLLQILLENTDIVYEVGWDIPSLLISYIDSDMSLKVSLRQTPCVYKVLKIFEVLAHHGNPKELFLKSTELLSSIKISHNTSDSSRNEKFYDLKVYCIFELIDSCMRRIHTLYPSRFLAMTVTSFINSIYINPVTNAEAANFIWKRLYTFARNYTRPPLPADAKCSPEELAKICEDEDYLQRKLLTAFITESINLAVRSSPVGYSVDLFNYLQLVLPSGVKYTNNYQLLFPVLDRLHELALSFDMNLTSDFEDFVLSSRKLVETPLKGEDVSSLFEVLVIDYQKLFAQSLVSTENSAVSDSLAGKLILFTHSVAVSRDFTKVSISIADALAITLRLAVPGMVHEAFISRGQFDVAVFWSWYAIHKMYATHSSPKVEVLISAIPETLLLTYFQSLLFMIISSHAFPYYRFVMLTLLTKLLSLAPEDIAYKFIMDSLRHCPYENIKAALVGVLKELFTKDKATFDSIADSLNAVQLEESKTKDSESGEGTTESASKDIKVSPPLPAREAKATSRYFALTDSRIAEIFELADEKIEITFPETDSGLDLSPAALPTLSALLNLLVVLKPSISETTKLKAVTDAVLLRVSRIETQWKDDPSKTEAVNTVRLLTITIDRINA